MLKISIISTIIRLRKARDFMSNLILTDFFKKTEYISHETDERAIRDKDVSFESLTTETIYLPVKTLEDENLDSFKEKFWKLC